MINKQQEKKWKGERVRKEKKNKEKEEEKFKAILLSVTLIWNKYFHLHITSSENINIKKIPL